jgi:hypothetical protein
MSKIKVRGIYATAITLLLSQRFEIVEPSEIIQARLNLPAAEGPAEVNIYDRSDRHGVVIEGLRSAVEEVVAFLRDALPWALFIPGELRTKVYSPLAKAAALLARYEVEFTKPAKDFLDQVRAKVVPTLPGHHLLKTVDPNRVDEAEEKLAETDLQAVAQGLWEELVGPCYSPGKIVTLWHIKAGEPAIRQTGEILDRTRETIVLRRNFGPGGMYDGLGLPKEPGDYGFFELYLDKWWGKRQYFRADGTIIGEIYNIHTPPELLPQGIRYLDLELDLVRVGEEIRLMDEEILEKKVSEGLIPEALAKRAKEVAAELLQMAR